MIKHARLQSILSQRSDYILFIGIPLDQPSEWKRASYNSGSLSIDGTAIPSDRVIAFLVAYPNKQAVDFELAGLSSFPPGITALEPGAINFSPAQPPLIIAESDLVEGNKHLKVSYEPSPAKPHDKSTYATTVTNVSGERLRILSFAGYQMHSNGRFHLNTVTKHCFSAEEFSAWYGSNSEWLSPGTSVTDHNNYGSPPVIWAYLFQLENGPTLLAGALYNK